MSAEITNGKRIAKNTLLLYLRMIFLLGINLFTSREVLAALGAIDFGIYNVVGGFVTMFTMISGAMATATQRFISFEIGRGADGNVKAAFSTAVIIHVFLALLVFCIAETIGLWFINTKMSFPPERYVAVNWVYQFSVVTFMINIISVPYNASIIAYEKMAAFAYVSIFEAIAKLAIVYLIIWSPVDKLILYASLLALVAILVRIIYGFYCNKQFVECKCTWKSDKEIKKKMMSFVSWNLIGSLSGVLKEQGINVLLNIFFGAAVNAARGLAFQVNNAIHGFVANFQIAMNPQIVKTYASGNKDDMFKIVFQGSKFSYMLLLTLSMPVIIEAPYILNLWLKEVPEYTVIFLRLVMISALIESFSGPLIASMHASGKVRDYQIVVGGLSLLTLPFAYIVLKVYPEPYWAMVVGIVMAILCLFARLYMLRRSIGLPVFLFLHSVCSVDLLITLLSSLIPILIYINLAEGFLSFIAVCIVCVVSTGSFSYVIGLNKKEKVIAKEKLYSILYKIRSRI